MAVVIVSPMANRSLDEDCDIRVEDYLNDKLQTYADLENLDSLLETVKQQQSLLREQVTYHYLDSIEITDFISAPRC